MSDILKDFKLIPEPIHHVDATPDKQYPLRILRAYRENCNSKIATSSDGSCDNPLFQYMNECSEERAKILDEAIQILEKFYLNNS